jgi:hypothetical protein
MRADLVEVIHSDFFKSVKPTIHRIRCDIKYAKTDLNKFAIRVGFARDIEPIPGVTFTGVDLARQLFGTGLMRFRVPTPAGETLWFWTNGLDGTESLSESIALHDSAEEALGSIERTGWTAAEVLQLSGRKTAGALRLKRISRWASTRESGM